MQRESIKRLAKAILPEATRRWVRKKQMQVVYRPLIDWFYFRSLQRLKPIRPQFGWGSGQCVDRYYIEKFLAQYDSDIYGRVLEIGDNSYTRKFGGELVVQSDVLHATSGNPQATIIGDLTYAEHVSSEIFNCIILTQTLQCIYDVRAAIRSLFRILMPEGVVLATFPGISQIARFDMEHWGDYWRFTTLSARKLFTEIFPDDCVTVKAHGNVFTAIAFLQGLVSEELNKEELDYFDPDYEVIITVRAMKPRE